MLVLWGSKSVGLSDSRVYKVLGSHEAQGYEEECIPLKEARSFACDPFAKKQASLHR